MEDGRDDQRSVLKAVTPGPRGRRRKTFESGRTCGEPGCNTRLSIYNDRDECWQHAPAKPYYPKLGRSPKTSAA